MWWSMFPVIVLYVIFAFADDSLVVTSTEAAVGEKDESAKNTNVGVNPQIYSMQIHANVSNRFARTLITSKVRNLKTSSEETTFSVIIPDNAFVSEFEMEIKDKVYKAYVKEKEEAKQIYQQAVSRGQSAAHVELSARDSKTFTVSVNIEPESKTIFRLVYEELLQRQLGQYELVINIRPGQTVEDLGVQVYINESRPLTFVRTPSLRTGNEINKNKEGLEPNTKLTKVDDTQAIVNFKPNVREQKEFGVHLGGDKENGLAGQFIVQYDVERDPQGGEVLVRDGYFVHFLAPSALEPRSKHVVFVLDHSGSMGGRKFDQLVEAMQNILSDLNKEDLFDIVRFGDTASVWDATNNTFNTLEIDQPQYGALEPHLREASLPDTVKATLENISKAKNIINDSSDMGMTNVIAGLEVGLFLVKRTQETQPEKYQPIVVFLTDGLPNLGMRNSNEITNTVTRLNSDSINAAIFSLSFGTSADKDFLRKLSLKNYGFSRHIYESSDASLQLQDFYKTISNPILSNVTFKYVDGVSQVTRTHYPILFKGSELVVAGRTERTDIAPYIDGVSYKGKIILNATHIEPVTSLERLWAYLTVKQLLAESEIAKNDTELKKKALDLSLKYSFVTPVSSLVVVKPNETISEGEKPSLREGRVGRITSAYPTNRVSSGPVHHSPRLGGPSYHTPMRRTGAFYSSRSSSFMGSFEGRRMLPGRSSTQPLNLVPSPYRPRMPAPPPTLPPPASTTSTGIPQWLLELKNQNANITTPLGSFKLGQNGSVVTRPDCPKTPTNSTGFCTIIFDCPQVFSLIHNLSEWLPYFCPLNEFAGICCPGN